MQKDIFTEQLVKKVTTPFDVLMNIITFVGAIILIIILLGPINSMFKGLTQILALGVLCILLGAVFLVYNKSIEYEYIYTNGDLDIDKIVARRRRKRILSIKCGNVTQVGKYTIDNTIESSCSRVMHVDSGSNQELWYLVFSHREYGKTMLVLEPNEEMLNCIKVGLSRELSRDVFGRS